MKEGREGGRKGMVRVVSEGGREGVNEGMLRVVKEGMKEVRREI